jgi:hypothetical protein
MSQMSSWGNDLGPPLPLGLLHDSFGLSWNGVKAKHLNPPIPPLVKGARAGFPLLSGQGSPPLLKGDLGDFPAWQKTVV